MKVLHCVLWIMVVLEREQARPKAQKHVEKGRAAYKKLWAVQEVGPDHHLLMHAVPEASEFTLTGPALCILFGCCVQLGHACVAVLQAEGHDWEAKREAEVAGMKTELNAMKPELDQLIN